MALTLDPTSEAIGPSLRDLRHARGMSQQRLAELAGCSLATVRLYEGGYRATQEMLERLEEALRDETPASNPALVQESAGRGPTDAER